MYIKKNIKAYTTVTFVCLTFTFKKVDDFYLFDIYIESFFSIYKIA